MICKVKRTFHSLLKIQLNGTPYYAVFIERWKNRCKQRMAHPYVLVSGSLIQGPVVNSSRHENTKQKAWNDDSVISPDLSRQTDVDATLWKVILSVKWKTAAVREYISNANSRLESVKRQKEETVAKMSCLQIEMQTMRWAMKTLVHRIIMAEITTHRQQNEIAEFNWYSTKKSLIMNFGKNDAF